MDRARLLREGPFRGLSSACLEVSHLPGQDVPLLQTAQVIVLRTKPFDGFIVPKFTPGPSNFRAGRECRAGRVREVNGPGSRQEIATYKSVGTDLPLKASTCGAGQLLQSRAQDARAKWIKVVLHLPGLLRTPASAAWETVGPLSQLLVCPAMTSSRTKCRWRLESARLCVGSHTSSSCWDQLSRLADSGSV